MNIKYKKIEDRSLKNTQPAVMTDKGPNDTTRAKSKDGKYTAGEQVEETDPKKREQVNRILDSQFKSDRIYTRNKQIDANIYEPIFVQMMERTILNHLNHIKTQNQKPLLIKANSYYDMVLGVDFITCLRDNTTGDQLFQRFIDVKTVEEGMGDEEFYKNPNITLNLYKTEKGSDNFKLHSFLNQEHKTTDYCYIIPYTPKKPKLLDPEHPTKEDTGITEAKMYMCKADRLQKYVQERILDNADVQKFIQAYEIDDTTSILKRSGDYDIKQPNSNMNSFRIKIPVAGENFTAELYLREDTGDGHKEVRLFLPTKALKSENIKCLSHKIHL